MSTSTSTSTIPTNMLKPKDTLLLKGDEEGIQLAAKILKRGDLVAMPTETVYGLASNALNSEAVDGIFVAKGRPRDNPLICHISNEKMVDMLVDWSQLKQLLNTSEYKDMFNSVSDTVSDGKNSSSSSSSSTLTGDSSDKVLEIIKSRVKLMMDHFWPGPLTLLLPAKESVPKNVTCGLPTVGVRMPNHPVALKLIEECGFPLAAPSANTSGRPSPTTANHVMDDLKGRVDAILDGGACHSGVESTVLDVIRNPPLILRPGGVTYEQIKEVLPEVLVYSKHFSSSEMELKPSTPGMKYRHYSPDVSVVLFEGDSDKIEKLLIEHAREWISEGKRVGIIKTRKSTQYPKEWFDDEQNQNEKKKKNILMEIGDEKSLDAVAKGLFQSLRGMESESVDVIFAEGVTEEKEGLAIMNRLRKAASTIVNV